MIYLKYPKTSFLTFETFRNQSIHLSYSELAAKFNPDVEILYINSPSAQYLPVNVGSIFPNLINYVAIRLQIKKIYYQNFKLLNRLNVLILILNEIETIDSDTFDNCVTLLSLYLNNNKIQSLPEQVFGNTTNLVMLNLEYNQLTSLPVRIFENLTELATLDLNGNHLRFLTDQHFRYNYNLKILNLNSNEIVSLSPTLIDDMDRLRMIDLRQNQCIDDVFYEHDNQLIDLERFKKIVGENCRRHFEPIESPVETSTLFSNEVTVD